jgi:hypothetical protein
MERVRAIWVTALGPLAQHLLRWHVLAILALAAILGVELRTSWLQSKMLAATGRRLTFQLEPGPSSRINFPRYGPYDSQLGYTRLPDFIPRLEAANYRITAQARSSPFFFKLTGLGLYAPYHEKTQAGLEILDSGGTPLVSSRYPRRIYPNFASIPPGCANTGLHRKPGDPG